MFILNLSDIRNLMLVLVLTLNAIGEFKSVSMKREPIFLFDIYFLCFEKGQVPPEESI